MSSNDPRSPAAIRARLAAAKPAQASPIQTAELKAPAPPEPTGKPKGPMLKFKCGHEKPLDRFTGKDCPGCRDKAQREERKAAMERRAAKGPRVRKDKPQVDTDGRLPDLSVFRVSYDARTQIWRGVLEITNPTEGSISSYDGEHTSVEKLLRLLAGQWRATIVSPILRPEPESCLPSTSVPESSGMEGT